MKVKELKSSNTERPYYQAICAVTNPKIPTGLAAEKFEYSNSKNETVGMSDIKRIKRH